MGNAAILLSIWRLGSKHRDAWLWSIVGNACWSWSWYGISTGLWSIVFINSVMIAIAIRNWSKWK